ncbi:universal stress protein [Streptomyces sp. L2]|uniref:universal stress protein n=1 Tax=Streptomyces sp. L2 TaxID=2162665 RepID=UPI001011C41F|nr:universal stress protein [Streptomyces sp. L2]
MSRTIIVGLDGSPESRAAAEWAAQEAALRGLPLRLVHVWESVPDALVQASRLGAETLRHWSERIPREAAAEIRRRHPGVDVGTKQIPGTAASVLAEAAQDAELLVLGSRGLSGVGGFLVGSVGMAVIARAEGPVVLVRAGWQARDEDGADRADSASAATTHRPVVLGLDIGRPDDTVIAFAFEEAARRGTTLKAVHGWRIPAYMLYGLPSDLALDTELRQQDVAAMAKVLSPWREKYPDVDVVEDFHWGSPADRVIEAARDASLVVVGRRIRRSPVGVHIGPVTHAVLHHAVAPVAVVAHD